jgi:hypothetical protein
MGGRGEVARRNPDEEILRLDKINGAKIKGSYYFFGSKPEE